MSLFYQLPSWLPTENYLTSNAKLCSFFSPIPLQWYRRMIWRVQFLFPHPIYLLPLYWILKSYPSLNTSGDNVKKRVISGRQILVMPNINQIKHTHKSIETFWKIQGCRVDWWDRSQSLSIITLKSPKAITSVQANTLPNKVFQNNIWLWSGAYHVSSVSLSI